MGKITTSLFGDVAFLPYRAESPWKESLQWTTAINESYNGAESREQIRLSPLQEFELSIPLSKSHKIDAINILYGGIRDLVAIPVWSDVQYVGSVTGGATSIYCDTSNYSLRADSLAVLWNSYSSYQVVEIDNLLGDHVTLYSGADSRVGAYFIPVRIGHISDSVTYDTDGSNGPVRFKFCVKDNSYTVGATPTQYDSTDIYYDEITGTGGKIQKAISQRVIREDFGTASFNQWTPWTYKRIAFPYRDIIQGASNIQALRRFLGRRLGMYRPFYFPSWEMDFSVESTGTITTTIDVASNNIIAYASERDHCVFIDRSGNKYPRHIDVWTQIDSNTVRLTLDTALNIDASEIELGCYLGYFRFDSDRVELNWIGNDCIQFSIPIIEIKPHRAPVVVVE